MRSQILEAVEATRRGELRRVAGSARETIEENWLAYAFILPTLLFLVLLLWFPLLRGVWMSFHEWILAGSRTWVGLDNYTYLFGWDVFWTSMKATLLFTSTTAIQLVIAMAAALVVANIGRFENLFSSTFLVAYTMPPVVTGTVWIYLLHPQTGPIFQYLIEWGLLEQPIYWSTNGDTALAAIIGVTSWTFWPFMFLIIYASLETIPQEYYETAKVYGANRYQTFRQITLPQLKSAILVAISIRMVWNLAKVSQPIQMTGGGPGFETSILAILLYRFGWQRAQLGMGFAVGIVLLIVTTLFIALFIREFEQEARGEA